jgi:hypothetical protein
MNGTPLQRFEEAARGAAELPLGDDLKRFAKS